MATTRVDVRFEPVLWRGVEAFMRSSRTDTAADAVRMLVELGLGRIANIDDAALAAMRRTCEREALKKVREGVDKSLAGERAPRE